jgi:hypothetical protein
MASASVQVGASLASAAALAFLLHEGRTPPALPYDLHQQTVVRPDGSRVSVQLGPTAPLVAVPAQGTRTLFEVFQYSSRHHAASPCLGFRPRAPGGYEWLTYAQVATRAANAAAGLVAHGLRWCSLLLCCCCCGQC